MASDDNTEELTFPWSFLRAASKSKKGGLLVTVWAGRASAATETTPVADARGSVAGVGAVDRSTLSDAMTSCDLSRCVNVASCRF